MPDLPTTPEELLTWEWPQFDPFAVELAGRPLSQDNLSQWLLDWSRLRDCMDELSYRLNVATTVNTADATAQKRLQNFYDTIYPTAMQADQVLKQKLLASGLEPAGYDVALRNMRAAADLYRPENLELLAEEQKLNTRYDSIIGAQSVQWDGKEMTVTQLRPVYQEMDRSRREQAWRLGSQRQLADRQSLNTLWQELFALRQRIAANAGKPNFRAYRWQQLNRFYYTPEDCKQFHRAIEEVVVPAANRVYRRRQERLGLASLRPWDLFVDPHGRPPLHPFDTVEQLKTGASAIFHRVDPQLGAYFEVMRDENLLDLDNRANKAPGGYSTIFPMSRRPFIFMNAVGIDDDVQTLLHEGGHSFQDFEMYVIPYSHLREIPMEFAEVASMSMELLTSPYLAREWGGFYSRSEAARALIEHLEWDITFWPSMAAIDAFQHWAYENPELALNPAACDETYFNLHSRFLPGVDWSGLEDILATRWQRVLHIYQLPFYMVEYGLAQLGAVQIWRNALADQAGAVAAYRHGMALGNSLPLPQLYQAAGARLAFDAAALNEAVTLMESKIQELETLAEN